MAQKLAAVVVGVVGLYLNIWHNSAFPLSHSQVFGGGRDGFGNQHYLHSIIGLVLIAVAAWLWMRAAKAAKTGAPATA